ncbi:MAG: hypothetical protein H0U74_21305 [Bradymonadaceae bacterium]|nr:hypothetical protein [Lujinxingiaceae bacterium]
MNTKITLVASILALSLAACAAPPQPAPNTAMLPTAESVAQQAGADARRLEAEGQTGVIFETSTPGELLVDGQLPQDQAAESDPPIAAAPARLNVNLLADGTMVLGERRTTDRQELLALLEDAAASGQRAVTFNIESAQVSPELVGDLVAGARSSGMTRIEVISRQ